MWVGEGVGVCVWPDFITTLITSQWWRGGVGAWRGGVAWWQWVGNCVWKVCLCGKCVCACVCVCEVGLKGVLAIIVLLKVTVILDPAMAHPASVGPANVTKDVQSR